MLIVEKACRVALHPYNGSRKPIYYAGTGCCDALTVALQEGRATLAADLPPGAGAWRHHPGWTHTLTHSDGTTYHVRAVEQEDGAHA